MKEILLTSSVLILALLMLRVLFRNSISRRVQYALWGLVLVRLLVPVSLPALDFSVLSVAEPVNSAVTHQLEDYTVYVDPVAQGEASKSIVLKPDASTPPIVVMESGSEAVTEYDYKINGTPADAAIHSEDGTHITWYAKALTVTEALTAVWCTGMAVMACWLLVTNLWFWRKLLRTRIPYPVEGCKYRTYLVESGLPSPCLFGLFRPAIYLTPAAVESPTVLRHVIAHEMTHAKHLDPLWALLRSLCLVIYWFDPLVWVAALVSKTDCELACDEGAMKQLGEGERLAYGHTLLALIPVRHGGTNPLLSATTMTADKKHLKDRITRIAENRQTVVAALFLAVAAVVVVCAVTFTGGQEPMDPMEPDIPPEAETPIATLSGEELVWFNEQFFNRSEEGYISIRNQFLSSQYREPEDIDLFELFYCGTGIQETMSEEELLQVGLFDAEGLEICPTDKISVAAMDEVLLLHLGLTLKDVDGKGLEHFTYLAEYDAYYHSHGDTNYRGFVTISAGEREDDLTRLYYLDNFMGNGWMCVTLRDNGSGGYWFVSNLPCDKPALPTVFPEGDPWMTISLDDLNAYTPLAVEVTSVSDDCAERGYGHRLDNDITIRPYLSTDGNIYAAVVYENIVGPAGTATWEAGRFFQYPEGTDLERCTLDFFSDLFGYNGIVVSYNDYITGSPETGGEIGTYYDFYAFPDEKSPILLARALENAQVIDLNGDGKNELLTGRQLFFERDGEICEVNIKELLAESWPELAHWDYGYIDINRRCLTVNGTVSMPEWGAESAQAWFLREVYFDGENLLIYRELPATEDHMAEGIPVNFPDEVYIAARERAMAAYIATKNGEEGALKDQSFNDWRLTDITPVESAFPHYPGVEYEVYRVTYQFHSADPGSVMSAGGMYVQEDGWVGGFYTEDSPYLMFHVQEDGTRVPLENSIPWDSYNMEAEISLSLLRAGLITWDHITAVDLCSVLYAAPYAILDMLARESASIREATLHRVAYYAAQHTEEETEASHLLGHAMDNLSHYPDKLTSAARDVYRELLAAMENPEESPEQTTGPIQGIALAGPYGDPLTANLLNRAQFGSAEEAISAVKADPLFAEQIRMNYDAEGLGIAVQLLGGYSGAKTMANVVWYLIYEDGTLARLPWPTNTVELSEEAPSKEGYCLTYEAVTEDGKTYTYFINPLYRTYSVKELKSTRSEVPLTVPPTPSTDEVALEELQKHSTIRNRWDGPVFSLLEASENGTPHPSNNYYCLLVDGSGVIHLPSMPRVSAFGEASPDKVEFSEDGAVLTYSCYLAEREGTELGSPSENVFHEAGLYTYRVEIMNRRVIQTYDPHAR